MCGSLELRKLHITLLEVRLAVVARVQPYQRERHSNLLRVVLNIPGTVDDRGGRCRRRIWDVLRNAVADAAPARACCVAPLCNPRRSPSRRCSRNQPATPACEPSRDEDTPRLGERRQVERGAL